MGGDLTTIEIYAFLRNVPLFREMNKENLRYLSENTRCIDLAKDQFVFHKGDRCTGFYVMVHGNIKISFLSVEGKEHVARIVGPGQSFAEAIVFLNKPSPAMVQAIVPAKVLLISSNAIFKCINENPSCAYGMLAGLSRRLHLLVSELESLTLKSSQQRVIGFLLQHYELDGTSHDETQITLQANKSTIASHLNLTPETLSRILHQLSDKELISVHGKIIHVNNVEKLRSLWF